MIYPYQALHAKKITSSNLQHTCLTLTIRDDGSFSREPAKYNEYNNTQSCLSEG